MAGFKKEDTELYLQYDFNYLKIYIEKKVEGNPQNIALADSG